MNGNQTLAVAALAGTALLGFAVSAAHAQTIYIDFGAQGRPTNLTGWNNMWMTTDNTHGPNISDLVDSTGATTGFGLTVTDAFAFVNEDGTQTPSGVVASYPDSAYRDSWYINTGIGGVALDPAGQLTFSNLPAGAIYNIGFFASRNGVGDSRPTDYTIGGTTISLDAANNHGNMVWMNSVTADQDGNIVLDVTKGAASAGFGYLGFMEIQAVPEPASLGLLGVGAMVLLRRRKA